MDPTPAQKQAPNLIPPKRQLKAANLAQRWWRDARRADPDHSYLIAKGVRPHGLRQRGAAPVLPHDRRMQRGAVAIDRDDRRDRKSVV